MKKLALTFLVIILLMAGIGIGVYLVRQNQNFREKAAPSSSLILEASTSTPNVGDTFTVSSNIQTGTNQVIAVEMHITFDETIVEAQGATPGSFLSSPQFIGPAIDNNHGTLSYTVYVDSGVSGSQGDGTVAVFTFKSKQAGNTTIAFSSDTLIGGVGGDPSSPDSAINLLTGTTPAIVNIQAAQATATPTTQSTGTPTPTTHATFTVTPTSVTGTSTPTTAPGSTATNTPTTTTGSTSSTANTNTPTPSNSAIAANPTTTATLPDSGASIPTLFGIGLGALVLIGSILLAL